MGTLPQQACGMGGRQVGGPVPKVFLDNPWEDYPNGNLPMDRQGALFGTGPTTCLPPISHKCRHFTPCPLRQSSHGLSRNTFWHWPTYFSPTHSTCPLRKSVHGLSRNNFWHRLTHFCPTHSTQKSSFHSMPMASICPWHLNDHFLALAHPFLSDPVHTNVVIS